MGEKSMKKDVKKKKKSDIMNSAASVTAKAFMPQPELIKKKKKPL